MKLDTEACIHIISKFHIFFAQGDETSGSQVFILFRKKQRYKDAFHNRTQGGLWQVWSSFREIQHITETLNHVENGPISLWLL